MRVSVVMRVCLSLLFPVVALAVCGNGYIEPGEGCDDANRYSGDGCSAVCALEDPARFVCSNSPGGLTSCCPALWNPVQRARVCSCFGQASGSPLMQVTPDCELVDYDECLIGNGGCTAGAVCVNLDGTVDPQGFVCQCLPGRFGAACDATSYAVAFELALYPRDGAAVSLVQVESGVAAALEMAAASVSARVVAPGGRRLRAEYTHVAIVVEAASWDAMQQLAAEANAARVAAFLAALTPELSQIAVLQQTTTLVREAPGAHSLVIESVPGFMFNGLEYLEARGAWLLAVAFYAPPGTVHVLFATRSRAPVQPAAHACAAATDVCCVRDMLADHRLGDFAAWAEALCAAPAATLAALPRERWIEGLVETLPSGASSVALSGANTLLFELTHADVRDALAEGRVVGDVTRYAFALGMLFVQSPHSVAVAQAALEVSVGDTLSVVVASAQHHSFLEHLDLVVYDLVEDNGSARVRFVRVVLVLPADVRAPADGALVPADSLEFAYGAPEAWTLACPPALAARYAAAGARECALTDMQLCATLRAGYVYTLDVPVGEAVDETSTDLFVRFAVRGERDGAGGVPYELLAQVSVQLLAAASTTVSLCSPAVWAAATGADFASVSVAVGTRLEAVDSAAVVFSNVLGAVEYSGLLDIAAQHEAASALDSLLLLVLEGRPAFFAAQPLASAVFDCVVTVHLRSAAKDAALRALLAAGAAYEVVVGAGGFREIRLSAAFAEECAAGAAFDCAVRTPVARRAAVSALAHAFTADTAAAAAWAGALFGAAAVERAAAASAAARERFALDYRVRQALWLAPAFAWPDAPAVGMADRTLVLAAFAVVA